MYCIYLTAYHGNKLPPFYIGYSTVEKVAGGYKGTVQSKLYKETFNQELAENPHLFKTFVVSKCKTRKEALEKEGRFQRHFAVHKNPMYINLAVSNEKFYCTDHSFKQRESFRSKVSENNRRRWADPEKKEKLVNAMRKTKGTEEWRKGQRERSRKLAENPEHIEKVRKYVKKSWEKEGEKERRSKIMIESYKRNPEFIEAKKKKKWWTDGTVSVYSEICPPGYSRGRVTPWQ